MSPYPAALGRPRLMKRWKQVVAFSLLLLATLALLTWGALHSFGFGPFQHGLYTCPIWARVGETTWRSRGALVLAADENRLRLRAWVPSFSVETPGPILTPVRIQVQNVLPAARLSSRPVAQVIETTTGTAREVEVPTGTGPLQLTWAPPPDDSFSFAVTGDIRSETRYLPSMTRDVDFLVIAGDVVAPSAELAPLVDELARLPIPVYTTLGNHDVQGKLEREYIRHFSPYRYSFSYGKARFLFYDNAAQTVVFRENRASRWLRRELEKGPAALTFVVMHRPPFQDETLTKVGLRHPICTPSLAALLIDLLGRSKVSAVFCGHIHEYHRWERNGVPYIVSGEGHEGVAGAPRFARVSVEGESFSITDETVE